MWRLLLTGLRQQQRTSFFCFALGCSVFLCCTCYENWYSQHSAAAFCFACSRRSVTEQPVPRRRSCRRPPQQRHQHQPQATQAAPGSRHTEQRKQAVPRDSRQYKYNRETWLRKLLYRSSTSGDLRITGARHKRVATARWQQRAEEEELPGAKIHHR